MSMVKSLEDLCMDFFLKGCNRSYFEDDEDRDFYKLSLYCQIDGIVMQFCCCAYFLCECSHRQYKNESFIMRDWCLFDKDTLTFCFEFNDLRLSNKVIKIFRTFDLFFRILDYWNEVNKKVFHIFFYFLTFFEHLCL